MPNIWIFLVVILSSLLKGLTGFGFALISFPLLLIWYAPKEIIPVLMICNLIASVFIILQKKEYKLLDKQSYVLIVSGALFTILGVVILSSSDGTMLVRISGVFFIILTLFSLRKRKIKQKDLPNYSYVIAGAFIGFLTGAISVSGPPMALFLKRAQVSNLKFREIFAWFSIVTAIIAIFGYYHTGILTLESIKTALIFTPILFIGTLIGKRFNSRISMGNFQAITIVLTLVLSFLMVIH